jgi:hypothetical protein
MPSSSLAVASAPDEQSAMSPAPTSISLPGGGGGGGGAGTVISDVPVFSPAVAVMDAVPVATPLTSPVDDTVATAGFDDAQTNVVADPVGFAVAVSCVVALIATVADEGVTDTDLTVFGGPPLANDGERLSGAGEVTVSEQATNATAAAVNPTPAMMAVLVRITTLT